MGRSCCLRQQKNQVRLHRLWMQIRLTRLRLLPLPLTPRLPLPLDAQPQIIGAEPARNTRLPTQADALQPIIFAGPLLLQAQRPSHAIRPVWKLGKNCKPQLLRVELLRQVVPQRITGVELPQSRVLTTRLFARMGLLQVELPQFAMRTVSQPRLPLAKLLLVRLIRHPARQVLSIRLTLGPMMRMVNCCRATLW